MDCLGSETVALYVAGALTPGLRARADAHVDRCPACRTWIARAARMATREGGSVTDPGLVTRVSCPSAGTRLGRYVGGGVVGRGAMGVVLRGEDPLLARAVALKLLHRAVDDETTHAALLGEARSLARLSHPNVVQVFDVGTWCGRLFLAMELVDGTSLRRAITDRVPSRRERLQMLMAAGRGLAAAHAAGIVHRDFKPDNVLVANDGRVLVGDFGLALSSTTDSTDETESVEEDARIVGTPAYMAPEQRIGGNVEARADQFAFCVTAVELLLGWRPSAIDSSRELARFMARARPLARPLVQALARGLSFDAKRRHRGMDALLLALERGAPRRWPAAMTVGGLAAALAWTGMPREAPMRVDPEPTPEATTGGVASGLSHALRSALVMALRADDPATARRLADAAVASASESGDAQAVVAALRARGKLDDDVKEETNRIEDLEQAHALAHRERLDEDATDLAIVIARKLASRPEHGDDALAWLRRAEAGLAPDSVHVARIAGTRARIAVSRGDFATAAAEADRAVAWLGQHGRGDDVEILLASFDVLARRGQRFPAGEVFDDIVETWCVLGHCDRSSIAGRRMLDRLVRELGPDDRGVAYARIRLAYHLFAGARFDEAVGELDAAVAVLETQGAAQPFMLAIAVQRLSTVHSAAGRIDLALQHARRAATLVEQAYGRDSPNFVTAMLQLATVERAAGESEDARRHLEWALVSAEQTLGPAHPLTAIVLTESATLARAQNDRARARIASERSMALHEARGNTSPDYATALGLRAWAILLDDPATARTMLQRQVALFEGMRASTDNPAIFVEEEEVARRDLAEAERRLAAVR